MMTSSSRPRSAITVAGHTLGTPDHSVPEAIRLFAAAGLDAAEVIWQDGYRSGIPESAGEAELREIEAASRETGLPIIGLTPYMTELNSVDEGQRVRDVERFAACFAVADRLGARIVRAYAGNYTPSRESEHPELWIQLVRSLRELAPIAAAHDVVIAVENHFNTMTMTAAETVALIEEVDSPQVRILYDQANLTFTHSESPDQAIAAQAGLVEHVHVKDLVFIDRDRPFRAAEVATVSGEDRAVRSRVVGDGELAWKEIIARMWEAGYSGAFSLEYEYRWHPADLPDPAEGFRIGAQRLRQYADELAAV